MKPTPSDRAAGLAIESHAWSEWPRVVDHWKRLAASAECSAFVGAEWVDAWVRAFGDRLRPEVLLFRSAGAVVACCLLVSRVQRRGPFSVRRTHLNTAGEDEQDEVAVEFNDLLCETGWERPVAFALRERLDGRPWDELVLDGWMESPSLEALLESCAGLSVRQEARPSVFVDLRELRRQGKTHLSTLSSSTRRQVRRSRELYEQRGPLRLEVAADIGQALEMLEELAELHQGHWTARGRPGAFGSLRFKAFHKSLVESLFPRGGVQVLRVLAGFEPLGILYNIVKDGKVCFYQSGLRYEADNRLKPGLLAHCLAIEHNLARGLDEYDFLAGSARYKRSLANRERRLRWVVITRPSAKMRLIEGLRSLRRLVVKLPPAREV